MHFYKHHIGDYAQATAHLSFVEDAAYGRLIRKYYADEKPLPADVKAAQRLVGARTREERAAVESVLREFFTLEADGWRNKRCDAEIEKAQAKAARNREVGKLGGRPAGSGNRDGSEQEPRDNPEGFPVGSENNPSQDSKTPRLQDSKTSEPFPASSATTPEGREGDKSPGRPEPDDRLLLAVIAAANPRVDPPVVLRKYLAFLSREGFTPYSADAHLAAFARGERFSEAQWNARKAQDAGIAPAVAGVVAQAAAGMRA